MDKIQSRGHQIYTETVNKIALSCADDKSKIREDGIGTHAYGSSSWNSKSKFKINK